MQKKIFSQVFTGNYLGIATKYRENIKELLKSYDIVIFMARKAICFYEAMLKNEEIELCDCEIISSRVLDYNDLVSFKDKRVAIVDDVVVKGESLSHVADRLQQIGVKPYVLVGACQESFAKNLMQKSNLTIAPTYVYLDEIEIYTFAGMITAYIEASMCSFNIDQPLYYIDDEVVAQRLMDNNFSIDLTSGVQRKYDIKSKVIYFKVQLNSHNALGKLLNDSILKIRLLKNAQGTIAIPFVLLPEISISSLEELFEKISSPYIKNIVQGSTKYATDENKLKFISYFFSELLIITYFRQQNIALKKDDCNDKFQFSKNSYELYKNLGNVVQDYINIFKNIKYQNIEFSKPIFTEMVEDTYNVLFGIDPSKQRYKDCNNRLIDKEPIIGNKQLCRYFNNESGSNCNINYLVSCIIDVLIDRGVLVPTIVHFENVILRAYKGGEYSKLTREQLRAYANMLYNYQEAINDDLWKTELEKMCVLFFQFAIKFNMFEQLAKYEDDCYGVSSSLFGPRVSNGQITYKVDDESLIVQKLKQSGKKDAPILRENKRRYQITNRISTEYDQTLIINFANQYGNLRRAIDEYCGNGSIKKQPLFNQYVHSYIQFLTLNAIGNSPKNQFLALCAELYQITQLPDTLFKFEEFDKSSVEWKLAGINSGLWKYWCFENNAFKDTIVKAASKFGWTPLLATYSDTGIDKNPYYQDLIKLAGNLLFKTAFFINEALKAKGKMNYFKFTDGVSEESPITDDKTIFSVGAFYSCFEEDRRAYTKIIEKRNAKDGFDYYLKDELNFLKIQAKTLLDLCDLVLEEGVPNFEILHKLLVIYSKSELSNKYFQNISLIRSFANFSFVEKTKIVKLPQTESGVSLIAQLITNFNNEIEPVNFIMFNLNDDDIGLPNINDKVKGMFFRSLVESVINRFLLSNPSTHCLILVSHNKVRSFKYGSFQFNLKQEEVFKDTYIVDIFEIINEEKNDGVSINIGNGNKLKKVNIKINGNKS